MDLFSSELDAGSPLMLDMPEFEALELIWRKGPVEEPLRGLPASILTSQLAVQLSPPSEENVLIGDDEMAAWLYNPADMTDTRADLNRQTGLGSSNSASSVLHEKTEELDYQLLEPVLPENDAKSGSQVGPSETMIVCTEKAGASGLRRGKNNSKDKGGFDGQNKLTKQGSLIGSKFSTINSEEKKKEALQRSMSSRKLRIIKNHNLSEQKRRSRINERMRALQELVPRSSKLDKASILDATITHVKSLQKQVKILSMGYPMTPPIFSTGQPYIQSMPSMTSMGIGMGMNQDIAISMNIAALGIQPGMQFGPAIPYPHINQSIQTPVFPYSHIGDPYHFPHVIPGQVSQYGTANKKMKRKQDDTMEAQHSCTLQDVSRAPGYFAL